MDKIICVGKNYLEHAKELGDAVPSKPVLFLKPPSVLKQAAQGESLDALIPVDQGSVHHECEIVLQLRHGGYRMTLSEAEKAIGSVSVGLDMTLRDKQNELKKAGSPWTIAKVFPDAAIVGPWVSLDQFPDFLDASFSLKINGGLRQEGNARQMTLSPAQCVAYMSEHFPLCPGDVIFTGTPKGVAAVEPGNAAVLSYGSIEYHLLWHAIKP
jgi:2-keto-4-pentenoate hydratase/2-oxohepta-3-ene-1,7-dioic acid hydratase in catechol pathway